jgi:inorganic pyrophosphatase
VNTAVDESPYMVDSTDAAYTAVPKESRAPAAPIDGSIDKWFFLSGQSNL